MGKPLLLLQVLCRVDAAGAKELGEREEGIEHTWSRERVQVKHRETRDQGMKEKENQLDWRGTSMFASGREYETEKPSLFGSVCIQSRRVVIPDGKGCNVCGRR